MKRSLCIFLFLITLYFGAFAQRPKVGVVLCGGGAKGAAHVGVLKVLEEYDIPIDYIAGTSMGAIVGGLYSIGYSAAELDSLVMVQDWDFVMSDKVPRKLVSFEAKKYDDRYLLKIPFSFRRDRGDLADKRPVTRDRDIIGPPQLLRGQQESSFLSNIPMYYVSGHNVYNLFTKYSVGYQDSIDFNNMPIPFACVAVDLVGKKEVVFRSGYFVDAIRASMAIPGFFAPVRMDGMVLVDGGMLNNYPVDVAKEMGADIIIGVKLGFDDNRTSEIDDIGDLLNELLSLYMEDKTEKAIDMTDIVIAPSVKDFSTMSFDIPSLRTLIDNGEKAAREKSQELIRLKAYLDEMEQKEQKSLIGPKEIRKTYPKAVHIDQDSIIIGKVSSTGLSERDAEWLLKKSKLKPGAVITGRDIDEEISRFYNTGSFSSVTYLLKGTESPYHLEINFVKGLSSQLGVGFRFDSEEVATVMLNVSANNLALYGSKASITAKLAYNAMFMADYSYAFRANLQFNTSYTFRSSDLNIFNKGLRADNISFYSHIADLNFSTRRFVSGQTSFGMRFHSFNFRSVLSSSDVPPIYDPDIGRSNFISAYAKFKLDRMDREHFPSSGFVLNSGFAYHFNWLKPDEYPFSVANLHFSVVIPLFSELALIPTIYNRTLIGGNIPVAFMNLMGGYEEGRYMEQQIPFLGFNYTYAFKNILTVGSLDARLRLGRSHYILATGSYAMDSEGITDVFAEPGIVGVRLGYSYDSPIGPISFNLHWSNFTGRLGAYLSLGYSF
ncbi:MAG TPA: patatin-like phospholipase family protein [Bacteroidales bacterium]|nr:patatin-like phospholipase family protein [Bacteroidales bacterium]HPK29605.1 patatin-like phospholipase family protein [Bacteroidales bacterium]